MGHTMQYACLIKKLPHGYGGKKKMGIVVSVAALVLYVPMSMVFLLGGKK